MSVERKEIENDKKSIKMVKMIKKTGEKMAKN